MKASVFVCSEVSRAHCRRHCSDTAVCIQKKKPGTSKRKPVRPLWKTTRRILKKTRQWSDQTILPCPISGSASKEMPTGYRRKICTLLATAALFTIVAIQTQHARPSADARVRQRGTPRTQKTTARLCFTQGAAV